MKTGRTGSRLLSFVLCALITILVVKLAVTIIGTFHAGAETADGVPEAIAKEEKPKAEAQAEAPVELAANKANTKSGSSAADSLSALQQKEMEIRTKEEQLKEKEERLSRLEKEVEQKVKDLLVLQKQIQSTQNVKQEVQNNKVRGLAKIYGTMKPKEAAKLMENLDDKLVMGIISTMNHRSGCGNSFFDGGQKGAKISEALSNR